MIMFTFMFHYYDAFLYVKWFNDASFFFASRMLATTTGDGTATSGGIPLTMASTKAASESSDALSSSLLFCPFCFARSCRYSSRNFFNYLDRSSVIFPSNSSNTPSSSCTCIYPPFPFGNLGGVPGEVPRRRAIHWRR